MLAAFGVALVLRVVLAVAIYVHYGGSLFGDDRAYSDIAEQAANGSDRGWSDYTQLLYPRTGVLVGPVTVLYEIFGPVKLLGQLWVVLLGSLSAALTARLGLEFLDRRFALAAGLLVALIPSQVLWSSLIMKDAGVWVVLAGLGVVVAVANRTESARRLAALGVLAAGLVTLLGFLRLHTLEIAAVALVIASAFGVRQLRWPRIAGALVILLCVPVFFNMTVAGFDFVRYNSGTLEQRRADNAKDAATAVAPTTPDPNLQGESPLHAELSYLPKGIAVVALRPWPWESGKSNGIKLARLEAVLWYAVLALAIFGLVTGVRRGQLPALAFPLLTAGAILVMYGLTEGNVGTAYRHRNEVVGTVALLAAAGMSRIAARRREARRTPTAA